MRLRAIGTLVGVVLVLGGMFWAWRWFRSDWIDAGYVGVMYNANGGLQNKILKPQRVYVGWRQRLYKYPTMLRVATYSETPTEGEETASDGIQISSSDNANTKFDVSVFYRVKSENVFLLFKTFGPIPIEEIQTNHIRRAIREAVNDVGTRYDVFELMGTKRLEVSYAITEGLKKRLEPKGLTIEFSALRAAHPQETILAKIGQRVNSYTNIAIADSRREIALVERKTAEIKNEAEAQARKLTAATTQERSMEMLKLQTDEMAIDAWNGQLPFATRPPSVIDSSIITQYLQPAASQEQPEGQ